MVAKATSSIAILSTTKPYGHCSNVTRGTSIVLESPTFGEMECVLSKADPFSVVVVNGPSEAKERLAMPYAFYAGDLETGDLTRILTFRDGQAPVVQPFGEDFDLEGTMLKTVTLPWAPYLYMSCSEQGSPCKTSGLLHDLMDTLALMFNFTWSASAHPTGRWIGVRTDLPTLTMSDVPENSVLHDIASDKIDFGLSIWTYRGANKRSVADFSTEFVSDRWILIRRRNDRLQTDWAFPFRGGIHGLEKGF